MSVIRARRSMSDLEFYHRALKIDTLYNELYSNIKEELNEVRSNKA